MKFRKLKANEIELRVGTCTSKGFSLLLYKTARTDSNILDETVGPMNWQSDYKTIKDNLYCGIGIFDDTKREYVWKWDCGSESYNEKEKGEASDAFKRAGFKWGIGRELYTSPFIWHLGDVEETEKSKYIPKINIQEIEVAEIEYAEDRIVKLVLKRKGREFWSFDKKKTEENNNVPKTKEELKIQKTQIEIISKYYKGENLEKLLKNNNLKKLEDMSLVKASEICKELNKKLEEKENGNS